MVVQFRVPVPSSMALLNLFGVACFLAVVVSVGALTSWAWGLLAFGALGMVFVMLAQSSAQARPAAVTEIDAARQRKAA